MASERHSTHSSALDVMLHECETAAARAELHRSSDARQSPHAERMRIRCENDWETEHSDKIDR